MALSLLAANNAQTVLAAGISSTATSLTVNAGTGTLFPSPAAGTSFFKLTIIDAATGSLTEIVHVTARAGDVFTIQRGQEGTVPRAWSANDIAANMMTAGTLSYILGNFQPLDPTLTALAALVGVANKLPYFNGGDTAALTDLTQVGRDIIGKSTIADILTYLGLVGGLASDAVGRLIGVKIITASTIYAATSGTKKVLAIITGGGGAGGSCSATTTGSTFSGAGGGAGGTCIGLLNLADATNKAITIGAGGEAELAGGSTTFAGMVAGGGGGSGYTSVTSTPGGTSGTATGGIMNIPGGPGGDGQSGTYLISGMGGGSLWGTGGRSGQNAGISSIVYGAGGGGAYDTGFSGTKRNGGNGAPGVAVILEFA
ncbi:TPA: hypothetical protein R8G26_004924 [Citrobacter braakii]|nr:hypothetical protein [Citrobacter braakii]